MAHAHCTAIAGIVAYGIDTALSIRLAQRLVYTRYSQLIRTKNPQSDKRHPMTDARLSFSTATH